MFIRIIFFTKPHNYGVFLSRNKCLLCIFVMEQLDHILGILQVKCDTLTSIERNALELYVVNKDTLETRDMSSSDWVKIDRMIDTIAYIMEKRVDDQEPYTLDVEDNILAMGWCDDFAKERIKCFSLTDGDVWWGHRLISQWAKDWMSSLFAEYRYNIIKNVLNEDV